MTNDRSATSPSGSVPTSTGSAWAVFRQPHFSPYKCYLRRDLGLGVLLNPKVGSTAFRRVLVEGLTNAGASPQLGRLWPVSRTRRYTTAPIPDYFHAFSHQADYDFRCFVRNPYARVLSAWNDKLVKGFNSPSYPRSMRKLVPQLRRFAADQGLPGADDNAPFPFASFLSYIESQPEGRRNQHWDTQRSVLLADHVAYRHVYHMETAFVSGMADTLALVGIPPDWTTAQLARPTNASGKIATPVYTDALAERVHALYAVDFERFGFERDSWQGL
ncbi:sulfotransferase family 2 domain-containing protein [Synoicihabitans lomoniglobus]|uniref:Sulfotransferase family 2 domain-containing protein n=1 Tax=Synoicihabitans lomoniglobus TaxID=2909285 RepID=A0AAF0CQU1_9BACT|nr:sulfotransferase family protein [Opitutaceae bacterium LMO-M01]WED66306.1 sulfotransferase family 2 domain-containing protein [Opitutaceae bacterium LMO-M01]